MANPPPHVEMEWVGENLRRLREARGWNRLIASEKAGISESTVGRIERADRSYSFANLLELVKAYGVGLAELLAPVDQRPREPGRPWPKKGDGDGPGSP